MTNEELKNKVAEKFADALIAEGLTFDKTAAVLGERADAKTLIYKAQYYDEMKRRAEVAEKAFSLLYKECAERLGWDIDCTMWYKQQAERELVEEGGR